MSGSLCCSQPAPFSSCRLLNPAPPPPRYTTKPAPVRHLDWLEATAGREGNARLGICPTVLSVQFKGTW